MNQMFCQKIGLGTNDGNSIFHNLVASILATFFLALPLLQQKKKCAPSFLRLIIYQKQTVI